MYIKRHWRALALASAAILAIGACGGDDDDDAGSSGEANADAAEYCDSIVAVDEALAALNEGTGSPDAMSAAVADVVAAAPDDIAEATQNYADEAAALLGGGEEPPAEDETSDTTEATDTTDAESAGVEIDTELIAHVTQEEEGGGPDIPPDSFFEAQVEVYDYVADNCGFNVIDVTAKNYEFEGIPETIEPGRTVIRFQNEGTEYHEIALNSIPESEERSLEELLALPETEEPPFQPVSMLFSPPGLGAATTVDLAAGRHAALCFIPVGTTPEALASGELDESASAHFAEGMQAEFTVE